MHVAVFAVAAFEFGMAPLNVVSLSHGWFCFLLVWVALRCVSIDRVWVHWACAAVVFGDAGGLDVVPVLVAVFGVRAQDVG